MGCISWKNWIRCVRWKVFDGIYQMESNGWDVLGGKQLMELIRLKIVYGKYLMDVLDGKYWMGCIR